MIFLFIYLSAKKDENKIRKDVFQKNKTDR